MNWVRSLAGKPIVRALRIGALTLVCLALASPVLADGHHGHHGHHGSSGGGGGSVPEIDPSALTGALALLGGGVLVLTDRLRKK